MAPDVPKIRESLAQFEVDYRRESLKQWEQFLASFLQPERFMRPRGADREVLLKALGPDSPYGRIIAAASDNLGSLLTNTPRDNVPLWVDTLRRYAALKAKVAEGQKETRGKVEDAKTKQGETEAREELGYVSGYSEALEQLRRGELSTPEKGFRSAQKAFEEGEPTEKATHPVHRAVWNLQRLKGAFGSRQEEDRIVWALLLRPLQLASRVMVDEAGLYLQQQWDGLWLELTELSPGQKVGKVMGFANGPAASFLERRGDRYVARRLLGENVPFTASFLEYLSRSRLISPDNPGRLDPPRQIVAVQ
jgi:hypothetical protein